MSSSTEAVKARFQRFAESECKSYSPVYFGLAHWVAQDEDLATFISELPDQQPNLFFAAVQYLTGPERMPRIGTELTAFVKDHAEEIALLMRSHRTQTNEVGRCATLLPALPEGPLALVEVGASAGLCLMFERFSYDYGSVHLGDNNSPVRLRCGLIGNAPRLEMPRIVWRRGLDIEPVDLNEASKARWLLACVWPDHTERRQRLEAAMQLWREETPRVDRGDLVEDIPALLAQAPADATLVVFHSAVLPYVSVERRQAFSDVLMEFSSKRPVIWISNEGMRALPQVDALAPSIDALGFLLARTRMEAGKSETQLLGIAHAHGADLQWLGANSTHSK